MIRRRPIPKNRQHPTVSQHYELILDGAVAGTFPMAAKFARNRPQDAENTCGDSRAWVKRQNYRCGACRRKLSLFQATFDHWPIKRRMGAAFRDDRVISSDGEEINRAVHWACK